MLIFSLLMATQSFDPSLNVVTVTEAKNFMESSPIGNGRLGAMLFGGISHDEVVLNESTMWSGSPQDADRPEAYKVLPEIRRLLLAGENRKAQDLLQSNFICKGPGGNGPAYGCFQTFGDLTIDSPTSTPSGYQRVLNLDQAVSTVGYADQGTQFTREAFASAPAEVIAYHFTADRKGQINFTAQLSRKEHASLRFEGNTLVLEGQLDSGNEAIPGVKFCGLLRAVTKGGNTTVDSSGIHISGADEATLLFSAGSDMFEKNYDDHVRTVVHKASLRSYAELKAESVKDYQSFFHRVSLKLPEGPSAQKPTLARLIAGKHGEEDPSLAALYFNFGRYLLIGSSRPDSPLPANLQGLWAEEYHTPWNGDFHIDINVQMNYWLAEVANLSDCHLPLIKFINALVPNGEKTAKAYYDAPGWVAHVITNPWHFTSPGEGAQWGSTCTGGAWLCWHLWEHYAYTHDKAYLASVYPTLKGSAEFFLASLIAESKHGWLVTAPSNSPENTYIDPVNGPLNTCMGPTMDIEIVHELFTHVIEASTLLGVDDALRTKLVEARSKLAPLQIGKYGQLQEWLEDYEEQEIHHRHTSHLYALYPSDQISPETTPKLADAARKTLERRGDMGTGWSLAWKVCFWARLEDGDHAGLIIHRLLEPVGGSGMDYSNGGGTYPNLFDAHPPFQIDGNFGASAGIAEMLVQSSPNEIHLLPALPTSWASEGSVKGLCARGRLTVDVAWKGGKVTSYEIHGKKPKDLKVVVGSRT